MNAFPIGDERLLPDLAAFCQSSAETMPDRYIPRIGLEVIGCLEMAHVRLGGSIPWPVSRRHLHHPWVEPMLSRDGYAFGLDQAWAILAEHEYRQSVRIAAGRRPDVLACDSPMLAKLDWLERNRPAFRDDVCPRWPLTFTGEPVRWVSSLADAAPLYRDYVTRAKQHLMAYTGRNVPEWRRTMKE